ncbi:MAG TPA: ARMT1-like domain-containing protein [Polyangia bacterium]|nr:ARMT1-like domain-containing protein [Polyangia bacterium]
MSRPAPLPAYAPGSFALHTVQRRLPKILSDVTAQFADDDPRWAALTSALVNGGRIDRSLFSAPTPFWTARLASLEGRTWADQPFFDLEFLFYRAINSIAGDLRPGFDVFAGARRAALIDALPRVAAALDAREPLDLPGALLWSLSGNEEDLSQLARQRASGRSDRLIADQRPALLEHLAAAGARPVVILADNAGAELCFDLLLIDRLLAGPCARVQLHVKPEPMFVSDALVSDVDETIDRFATAGGAALAQAGARLRAARATGALEVVAPPDWAEPRHMNGLSPALEAALRGAALVIAKGDLNYRRFFEDRAWPADTAVAVASVASGLRAFALRVLKSDCVAGLPPAVSASLFAGDPAWRSSSRYAIVQRVDAGAPP